MNSKPPQRPTKQTVEPARKRIRPRTLLKASVALLAASTIVWAGIATTTVPVKSKRRTPPVDQVEMKVVLAHAGLDPRTLAAAGVSPEQAAVVAAAATTHLRANIESIRAAEAAYDQDRANVDRLQRLVQTGQAQPEDLAAYDAALASLAGSTAQRQTRLSALLEATTSNLSDQQKALMSTMAGNKGWDVPTQYLTASKKESEWVSFRGTLANQRVNTGLGQDVSPNALHLIQAWQAEPDVSAAAGYLDTNLPGISTAWDQGLTP